MRRTRRPAGIITKAAAKLAYCATFLLRAALLPLEYVAHVVAIAIGSPIAYLFARFIGPSLLVQGAQIDAPFSQTEQNKVYDWGVENINKYGLPLAIALSVFSPIIALFTAIDRTYSNAQAWGDDAYNCVAQENHSSFYSEPENRSLRFSAEGERTRFSTADSEEPQQELGNRNSRICRFRCFG